MKEFRFTFAFLISCFAKIGSLRLSAILLCLGFFGLSKSSVTMSSSSLSPLSFSSSLKKPVLVAMTPCFGFGRLCDTTFFFWLLGEVVEEDMELIGSDVTIVGKDVVEVIVDDVDVDVDVDVVVAVVVEVVVVVVMVGA